MLWNAILLAVREIRRNLLRSFLTILGIVIGVASVITMVTIGGGATRQVADQISSLGVNLMMISPGKRMGPGQSAESAPFKVKDAEVIGRENQVNLSRNRDLVIQPDGHIRQRKLEYNGLPGRTVSF